MAVKYFDNEKNEWVIFPGTVGAPGKNAYQIAVELGYKGSYEEYAHLLYILPESVNKIETADSVPTNGSNKLVISGGVYNSVKKVSDDLGTFKTSVSNTYVTKTELDSKGYLTDAESVTHTEMANALKSYALKTDIPTNNNKLTNGAGYITSSALNGYATETWVDAEIAKAKLEGEDIDLSGYATKKDIANFATKNELPSVEGLASQSWVSAEIAKAKLEGENVDLSIYATKTEVSNALNTAKTYTNTEIGKLSNTYATKGDIDAVEELISAISGGMKKASVNGGPGYTTVGGSYNLANLGYSEDKPFGVIVVSHGTSVSFTGAHMQATLDESDGSYDVYCIMYVNKMFLVNMCVYN